MENNVAAIPPAANGDNNVPLNQPVNPLPVSPLQRVVNIMQSLSQHGIRIPRTQGIILDMYSLVVALVGSIFPGWQPLAAVV